MLRRLLPLLLLLPLSCGRDLRDGFYEFTAVDVLQDGCRLEGERVSSGPIWGGRLEVLGDTVRLSYDLHEARNTHALIGRFLPDAEVERFIADATFDVQTEMATPGTAEELRAEQHFCRAFARLHVEGRVESTSSFAGRLRVDYQRRPEAAPSCLSSCVLELTYVANHVPIDVTVDPAP